MRILLAAMVLAALAAAPALAHHSMSAKYDTNQTIVLQGTVQKITWNNPHVRLYLQAPDKGVTDASWEFEMGSPNLLLQNGWKLGTFRQGDHVRVTAYPARDGSRLGYASKVSLSSH
jgi:opacity protein-like surface antigen